jgi:hypothetical protein
MKYLLLFHGSIGYGMGTRLSVVYTFIAYRVNIYRREELISHIISVWCSNIMSLRDQ